MEYLYDETEPLILGMVKAQPIIHRYTMPPDVESAIRSVPYHFGYGGFSEAVFFRTYSRLKEDGTKETFHDTIVRVVTGIISIIMDWKIKHCLEWDIERWNNIAIRFGTAFLKMQLLPPGRGLHICGTEFAYQRGSAAFNNCGFVSTNEGLIKSMCWTMDSLMAGAGIGFDCDAKDEELEKLIIPGCFYCNNDDFKAELNCKCKQRTYKIHDSREGWVKSLYLLVDSYFTGVKTYFDYSDIRIEGAPITGFGGTSSGPEPLRILHERVRIFIKCYIHVNIDATSSNSKIKSKAYDAILNMTKRHIDIYPKSNTIERPGLEWALSELKKMDEETRSKKTYGKSRLICDLFNAIGCCIVAGNVRRSSEIALSNASDVEFRHLKDHVLNPERSMISWMSNNTVTLDKSEDFLQLPDIAKRIKDNGEPGIYNRLNVKRYGRFGRREPIGREAEEDKAIGVNPCCISGDSMISTSEGLVCVRDLVGKQFIAKFDHGKFIKYYRSCVKGFWSNGIKEVFELKLKNGSSIKTTSDHRIAVYNNLAVGEIRWVQLQHIDIDNDFVITENNNHGIESIEFVNKEEVFDCTIPNAHSFYANGILVHNCEIPLESFEFCNLAEVFPTRCDTYEDMLEAAYLATIYCSAVSLLPTHWVDTNKVIARNRRIGISLSGIVEEIARTSTTEFTKKCRGLYRHIRKVNKEFADENGVVESIRVTTVKPSGTISQLVGVTSGIHHATYKYSKRLVRMNKNVKLVEVLKKAGYPHEVDKKSGESTIIFSFPLSQVGARSAQEVTMWEQASNLAMIQREFADNCVSCTIYFNAATEGQDLEHMLAQFAPVIKSLSALPHADESVYEQAPYQKISEEEYHRLSSTIKDIDYSELNEGNMTKEDDGEVERGCTNDVCDIKAFTNIQKS